MGGKIRQVNKDIVILMTTYFPPGEDGEKRLQAAEMATTTWLHHLQYYGGDIRIHVADDGSERHFVNQLLCFTRDRGWGNTTLSVNQRQGVGASLNAGLQATKEELILHAVDDWALTQELDLAPWAWLLQHGYNIGMVRLGPPHPELRGTVQMFEKGWYLSLQRYGFAFATRPFLARREFFEAYGPFPEELNALETERIYNQRFATQGGPMIALALPHPWEHLASIELAEVEP